MILSELESFDLRVVHALATLFGCFLAVYVMQLWGTGELTKSEPRIFVQIRRFGLVALALTMLWSLAYSNQKGWQPWPPHLFIILAVDILMASTVVSALLKRWRQNHEVIGKGAQG
jgi:hypothetical protein